MLVGRFVLEGIHATGVKDDQRPPNPRARNSSTRLAAAGSPLRPPPGRGRGRSPPAASAEDGVMVAITRPCSVTSSTSPFFTLDRYWLVWWLSSRTPTLIRWCYHMCYHKQVALTPSTGCKEAGIEMPGALWLGGDCAAQGPAEGCDDAERQQPPGVDAGDVHEQCGHDEGRHDGGGAEPVVTDHEVVGERA